MCTAITIHVAQAHVLSRTLAAITEPDPGVWDLNTKLVLPQHHPRIWKLSIRYFGRVTIEETDPAETDKTDHPFEVSAIPVIHHVILYVQCVPLDLDCKAPVYHIGPVF
jgi:hypothetical protein